MTSEIEYYKQLSKKVSTKQDKINFFDQNQKAFFLPPSSDNWLKMMKQYALTEHLTDEQVNEIEDLKWTQIPLTLKIYAFDYFILHSCDYQK